MDSLSGEYTHAGGVAFVTTQWSVVLAAQGQSTAADEALEKTLPHLLAAALCVR